MSEGYLRAGAFIPWSKCWPEVSAAVKRGPDRESVAQSVALIRGQQTHWDQIARAWRRAVEFGMETGEAHNALGTQAPVVVGPGRVKHGVIGDMQLRPGVPMEQITWIAEYFVDKQTDVVVQLGDWADMHSLSSWDSRSKKAWDRRSLAEDFEVANRGWDMLEEVWARRGWQPTRKVYLLGNHEDRIRRFVEDNPEHREDVTCDRFNAKAHGWEIHDFLVPVEIDGVAYSHFWPRSGSGYITQTKRGAPSALAQVKREMRSCTAGHQQGLDMAIYHAGGRSYRGCILGSSYQHTEAFLSPQGNDHWRGVLLCHSVHDGWYDACEVPLSYLRRRYA